MPKKVFSTIVLLSTSLFGCGQSSDFSLKNGDLLFQDFPSPQSMAVKIATNSEYSHCGIIFYENDKPMVWEAVQPVKTTDLDKWIGRDSEGHYVVKRLNDSENYLEASIIVQMMDYGKGHITKDPVISSQDIFDSDKLETIYSQ